MRADRGRALLLASALAIAGCPTAGPGPAAPALSADTKPGLFFPLAEGTAWTYDVTDATTGRKSLLLNRVARTDGRRAVFFDGADPLAYEDQGDKIVRWPSGATVLQAPLRAGASWEIPGGTARISATAAQVQAVHQAYAGCVVIEETTAETRVLTSFAPSVGPVKVEIWARGPGGETPLSVGVLRGYHQAGSQL